MNNGEEFDLLEIATQRDETCCLLRHIKITQYNERPSQINNFSVVRKGLKHYIFLSFMIAIPLFIIGTLITLVRDKDQQKKVRWFIFILFGFWGMTMNWTTGDISNNFFKITEGTGSIHLKFIDLTLLGAAFT